MMTIRKLLEILGHSVREVSTKKAREGLCGMLVMSCFLCMLVPIIHAFTAALTSEDATDVIAKCMIMVILMVGVFIVTYCANRYFVVQR